MRVPFRRDGQLIARARRLRREMTDAERRLWRAIRGDQLGARFRRQMVIDSRFIVDFYCPAAKLALELDGGQHALRSAADAERTRALAARGVTVLRFWNDEVLANAEGVLAAITAVLAEIGRRTPTSSLPLGGGGYYAGGAVALDTLNIVFGEIDR